MDSEEQLIHKLNEATSKWRRTRSIDDANEVADTLYDLFQAIKQRDYRLANNLAWSVKIGMEMPSQRLFDRLNDVMSHEMQ